MVKAWEMRIEEADKTGISDQQRKRLLDKEWAKAQLLQKGWLIFNGTRKETKQKND